MPWFPDFVAAVELARRETRAAGQVDPVGQYLTAVEHGDARSLETVGPGEVSVFDPYAGDIRGHRQLRQFVKQSQAMLAERHASTQTVASPSSGGRAVVECLAHLDHDGGHISWPVAVVAESPDDRSVVFRTYCSQWPVYVREPIGPFHRGTDDGLQCAVLYNCVRWGSHDLAPQAGIAVFERAGDGLLAAARVYDDVEPPVERA